MNFAWWGRNLSESIICTFCAILICYRYVESRIRSEADRASVRASPVLRKDFTALPPTLLLIAEVDPFKDSNYGEQLRQIKCVILLYFYNRW